jgi:hypothetical protein
VRERNNPRKLFVRVAFAADPTNPDQDGDGVNDDDTIFGISNLSNIPYRNIPFGTINDIGRQWVRDYTLALCMITLGLIRGKVRNIPVPNTDVQLNYDDLLSRGYEEKERLTTQLRDQLESMTYQSMVEREAAKAENLMKQLRGVPMPNGGFIVPG